MTKTQFAQCATVARNLEIDLSTEDLTPFDGCGLSGFKPIFVTVKQVARFIRWQSLCFNGEVDSKELQDCAEIARRSFTLI